MKQLWDRDPEEIVLEPTGNLQNFRQSNEATWGTSGSDQIKSDQLDQFM